MIGSKLLLYLVCHSEPNERSPYSHDSNEPSDGYNLGANEFSRRDKELKLGQDLLARVVVKKGSRRSGITCSFGSRGVKLDLADRIQFVARIALLCNLSGRETTDSGTTTRQLPDQRERRKKCKRRQSSFDSSWHRRINSLHQVSQTNRIESNRIE